MAAVMLLCFDRQRVLRRERVFRDRFKPLHLEDDTLLNQYRFPREEILILSDLLRADLEKPTHRRSQAVPVEMQVCVVLRFFASESFQNVLGSVYGLSQPTISRRIKNVTSGLCRKMELFISFPKDSAQDQMKLKRQFQEKKGLSKCFRCNRLHSRGHKGPEE